MVSEQYWYYWIIGGMVISFIFNFPQKDRLPVSSRTKDMLLLLFNLVLVLWSATLTAFVAAWAKGDEIMDAPTMLQFANTLLIITFVATGFLLMRIILAVYEGYKNKHKTQQKTNNNEDKKLNITTSLNINADIANTSEKQRADLNLLIDKIAKFNRTKEE